MKAISLGVSVRIRPAFVIATLATLSWSLTATATLPPTNNLVMWVKADSLVLTNGAGVSSWFDSSTNGNDVINHAAWSPTAIPKYYTNGINGRPAVGFGAPGTGGFGVDGNDMLRISNRVAGTFQDITLLSGFTFATAFKTFAPGDDQNNATLAFNYNNFLSDAAGATEYGLSGGSASLVRYDNAISSSWIERTGGLALNNTNKFPGHYVIATHSNNVGNLNDFVNVYADGTTVASGNIPYNAATTVRRIGQGFGGGNMAFNGLIGEMLIYSAPLSDADQMQLNTYLTERWLDIPEPGAAAMVLLGGVLLLRKRRSAE